MIVHRTRTRLPSGHTLIELMVAIVIGLIMVLASFQVLATFEGHKRTTSAMNDALQSGNFGLYTLDKLTRSAGTGIGQAMTTRYGSFAAGCALNYTSADSTTVTNGAVSLPAPFAVMTKLASAPAIIWPDANSDVLVTISGGGGFGEVPVPITLPPTGGQVIVESTVGFRPGDWILVGGGSGAGCTIAKTTTTATGVSNNVVLPTDSASLAAYANGYVLGLGKGDAASFIAYAVGDNNTLYSRDLLNGIGTSQLVSDDIVTMRAVYGVDPTGSGTLTWTKPVSTNIGGTTYNFTPAGLLAGTAAAAKALNGIRAVRVAIVVRAPLSERATGTAINNGTYTLFSSLPAAVQVTYNSTDAAYRYRVLEGTVPIRNTLYGSL